MDRRLDRRRMRLGRGELREVQQQSFCGLSSLLKVHRNALSNILYTRPNCFHPPEMASMHQAPYAPHRLFRTSALSTSFPTFSFPPPHGLRHVQTMPADPSRTFPPFLVKVKPSMVTRILPSPPGRNARMNLPRSNTEENSRRRQFIQFQPHRFLFVLQGRSNGLFVLRKRVNNGRTLITRS